VQSPILLVSKGATDFCGELQTELSCPVIPASNYRAALLAVRQQAFCLLVVDSRLSEVDPINPDVLAKTAGPVPLLEIDLNTMSVLVIARQARLTFERFAKERVRARDEAIAFLKGELRDSLSGLLLESQLALRDAGPRTQPKLMTLVQLASQLSDRLKVNQFDFTNSVDSTERGIEKDNIPKAKANFAVDSFGLGGMVNDRSMKVPETGRWPRGSQS
jgi:hypothetical protein